MSDLVLDDVDWGIIKILQKNARTSFMEVAKELGVSDATIHVRVGKLENSGVIKKYTIIVDRAKSGKPILVHILVNVDPGKIDFVAKNLVKIEDIDEIHEIHGRYDMLLKAQSESIEKIREIIINSVRKIPGVINTEVLTVFKTWKNK
ncbi:MAG: Lrp/AsnC family transcriptional regulator [Candidatus Bathyarchaeota archaeon]